MSDDASVIPILRSKPVIVEPGQTVEDAEWHAGWNAAVDAQAAMLDVAYERGLHRGIRLTHAAAPTWTNMAVCCTIAFVAGFCVALGYFGG